MCYNLNMSNKEAAIILRGMLKSYGVMARGNGKSSIMFNHMHALLKAIELLEQTPG